MQKEHLSLRHFWLAMLFQKPGASTNASGANAGVFHQIRPRRRHGLSNALAAPEQGNGTVATQHVSRYRVLLTADGGTYMAWQARICYYWYKKAKDADKHGAMGGFTRILHRYRPAQNTSCHLPCRPCQPYIRVTSILQIRVLTYRLVGGHRESTWHDAAAQKPHRLPCCLLPRPVAFLKCSYRSSLCGCSRSRCTEHACASLAKNSLRSSPRSKCCLCLSAVGELRHPFVTCSHRLTTSLKSSLV